MIDLFSVLIGAFIIVILSALYPAIKASKIDILQVLRNE
jgi:putative ABC transport system permease protein